MTHKHKFYPTEKTQTVRDEEGIIKYPLYIFKKFSLMRKWVCECGKIKWVKEI